jgi:hypothetical protein
MFEKLNPYGNCYCGSNKKLKFCCGQGKGNHLAFVKINDLNGIERKMLLDPTYYMYTSEELELVKELYNLENSSKLEDIPAAYEKYMEEHPQFDKAFISYLSFLVANDMNDKALEAAEKYKSLYPQYWHSYAHIASICFTNHEEEKAIQALKEMPWCEIINPNDCAAILRLLLLQAIYVDDEAREKELVSVILNINPKDNFVLSTLAELKAEYANLKK